MITDVKMTKTFYYLANLHTEKSAEELALSEALECLEKCLTDTGDYPPMLSLNSNYGSLNVVINDSRCRQKYRELFTYLIYIDIYGKHTGGRLFDEYMEEQAIKKARAKVERAAARARRTKSSNKTELEANL